MGKRIFKLKSAIDFILVNTLAYKLCQEMKIDEKQEKFDLSDHNLSEISYKLNDTNYQRRGKWEEKQYYRLDDESLDKYIVQLDLETTNDITIEAFNAMVSSAACRTLKSTYIVSVYTPFSDRVGLPLHNTPFPGVLMKSIGAAFFDRMPS